jgi:hypothetical protein
MRMHLELLKNQQKMQFWSIFNKNSPWLDTILELGKFGIVGKVMENAIMSTII